MAEQRNRFSFRLPWLPAARPRTPETQPPRPTVETQPPRPIVETQPPAQPTATIRPPFRPAGIAQVQPPPPPQVQAPPPPPPPPRVESQPSSPSRATTESKITSQPASPARGGTLPRVASLPSSPSRGAPQSKPPSSPQSPARAPRTPPQPRSPSRLITQVQPKSPSRVQPTAAGQTTSTPSSPQTTTQVQPPTAVASQPTGQTRPSSPSPTTTQVQPRAAEASQPDQTQPSTPSRITTQVQPTTAVASQPTDQTQPSSPSPTTTQVQPRATEASQPGQTQPSSHITTQVQPTTAVVSQPTGQTRPTSPSPTTTQVQQTSAVASQPTGQTRPASPSPTTTQAQSTTAVVSQTSSKPGSPSRTTTPGQPTVSIVAPEQILKVLTPIPNEGIKKPQNFAIQQEQEPHVKEAVLERHETLFPSGTSHDKHFKPAIPIHRKDRGAVSESHQRPENISVERAPFHKEIREDISKLVHKLGTAHPKQLMNEKPVSVITLAGENRGASMHLSSESSKKQESVHIYRGYKTNPDESAEATTDGEESSKGKRSRDPMTKEEQPIKPYVNGNVQSINNSILFNSSVTERNPGVHLVLSSNPTVKPNGKTESLETRKAQFNITPAEKHTYEPTVRRRCLRGLFMETSDSEPDNPDKPRRHGCRYNCGEKNKDKEIGVL